MRFRILDFGFSILVWLGLDFTNEAVFLEIFPNGRKTTTGASTFGRNIILVLQKPYYMVYLKKSIRQKWMLPICEPHHRCLRLCRSGQYPVP